MLNGNRCSIESLNQTLFILKSLIDRLTADLKRDGLCAEELSVSFFNEEDLFDERPIKLIAPTNSAKFLVEVIKLSLETSKLQRNSLECELLFNVFATRAGSNRIFRFQLIQTNS